MGTDIVMGRRDLPELYQLMGLYVRTYHPREEMGMAEWMEQVGERYAFTTRGEEIRNVSNPRMAGRKRKYTDEENERILKGKEDGKSLREIARETGFSLGHVQDVLGRHRGAG